MIGYAYVALDSRDVPKVDLSAHWIEIAGFAFCGDRSTVLLSVLSHLGHSTDRELDLHLAIGSVIESCTFGGNQSTVPLSVL